MTRRSVHWRFPDCARATALLQSTGWMPAGSGGLLRKYHCFVGIPVDSSEDAGMLEVRLGRDGVATAQSLDRMKRCPATPPAFVVPSIQVLRFLGDLVDDCNERLSRRHRGNVAIQWLGHNQFVVRVWSAASTANQPLASFPNPLAAYDWAVRLTLPERREASRSEHPEPTRWLRYGDSEQSRRCNAMARRAATGASSRSL